MSRTPRRSLQMSTATTDPASPWPQRAATSAARTATPTAMTYSCLVCKQRKVKCNRQSPCGECVRLGVECIMVGRKPYVSRKRRRATEDTESPEHSRQQNTRHDSIVVNSPREQGERGRTENSGGQTPQRSQAMVFGQNLWTGLREDFCEPQPVETPVADERLMPAVVAGATPSTDPSAAFIFGQTGFAPSSSDLKSLHPQPVHTFILWQTYLLSVNPLSKVIWAPQVQELVIQATSGYDSLSSANVALLFSIYAAAVSSLSDDECQAKLGEPKQPLLAKYLACAQQALAAAGFLRSTSLVLLQSFAIFLLAARQSFDANTMWILTGMAVRMGQRLMATSPPQNTDTTASANGASSKNGNTSQSVNSSFFDTQMRLRVWWQIVLIDGRVTQLAGQTRTFGGDLPDNTLPANLNDSDIDPHMTGAPPSISDRPTEMVFCLLRYEMGKLLISKGSVLHDPTSTIAERDKIIDDISAYFKEKYLVLLDPAIPLHQIAEAGANAAVLKMRLMAHHPGQYPDKGKSMPQAEHDMLFKTSVEMVNILVLGFTVMHIDPFKWHTDVYFQLDAVVFMLIESQTQAPFDPQVDKAWSLVASVLLHKPHLVREQDELGRAVRQLILRAWESRERRAQKTAPNKMPPKAPGIVADVLAELRQQRNSQQQKQRQPTRKTTQADDNPAENRDEGDDTRQETTEDALVSTGAGSTATEPLMVPTFNDRLVGLAPSLGMGYPTTTSSSLDASPFSSYNDMDVLGWETTDWDSWGYWNTLLQSQTV